jgi:raffinose/stachyose/melibiose transport system substrate-binding protein
MKKLLSIAALAVAFAMTFTACGGSKPSETSDTSASAASSTITEDVTQVKTDFKFITAMSDEARTKVLNAAIEKLKKKYPNVEFVNDSGEDYNNKAKLAFSSGDGYSLVLTDDLGLSALRDAGYLMDLTKYVKEKGWEDKQLVGATEFYNQRTPGKSYTVGMNYAPVIVYYNKDIFKKLNLKIPTTLDEFENVMKVAKANGYIGAENCKDNINGWFLQSLVQNKAPFQDVLNWYYRQESSANMKKAFIESENLLKKWSDAGYFRKDYIGIDYGDVPSLFGKGKTAMSLDGNWFLGDYEKTKLNVGIFAFPGVTDSKTENYIINPVDAAFAIGKQVNPTQLAVGIDFIDTMLTSEFAEQWLSVGAIPSVKYDYSKTNVSPLTKELLDTIKNTKSGFYLDNVKPGFLDVFVKQTQLFLTGDQTAEKMWDNLDAEWHNK